MCTPNPLSTLGSFLGTFDTFLMLLISWYLLIFLIPMSSSWYLLILLIIDAFITSRLLLILLYILYISCCLFVPFDISWCSLYLMAPIDTLTIHLDLLLLLPLQVIYCYSPTFFWVTGLLTYSISRGAPKNNRIMVSPKNVKNTH